jgi:hypothetical protein
LCAYTQRTQNHVSCLHLGPYPAFIFLQTGETTLEETLNGFLTNKSGKQTCQAILVLKDAVVAETKMPINSGFITSL